MNELIKYEAPYAKYIPMGPKCADALTILNKKKKKLRFEDDTVMSARIHTDADNLTSLLRA